MKKINLSKSFIYVHLKSFNMSFIQTQYSLSKLMRKYPVFQKNHNWRIYAVFPGQNNINARKSIKTTVKKIKLWFKKESRKKSFDQKVNPVFHFGRLKSFTYSQELRICAPKKLGILKQGTPLGTWKIKNISRLCWKI